MKDEHNPQENMMSNKTINFYTLLLFLLNNSSVIYGSDAPTTAKNSWSQRVYSSLSSIASSAKQKFYSSPFVAGYHSTEKEKQIAHSKIRELLLEKNDLQDILKITTTNNKDKKTIHDRIAQINHEIREQKIILGQAWTTMRKLTYTGLGIAGGALGTKMFYPSNQPLQPIPQTEPTNPVPPSTQPLQTTLQTGPIKPISSTTPIKSEKKLLQPPLADKIGKKLSSAIQINLPPLAKALSTTTDHIWYAVCIRDKELLLIPVNSVHDRRVNKNIETVLNIPADSLVGEEYMYVTISTWYNYIMRKIMPQSDDIIRKYDPLTGTVTDHP